MQYGTVRIYSGSASTDLASKIANYLDLPISGHDVITFPNDNFFIKLHGSARGQDCYVIQTTSPPVHRNLMELLITIQTLKLDSAGRITAVVPFLCYARSDKKDQPRVPITARLVADMIEVAGADRYMTMDLHAGQIQGFFSIPGDVLTAFHSLIDYTLKIKRNMHKPVVVTADLGFAKKARNFAQALDTPLAFIEKRRSGNDSKSRALTVIGDVRNCDVILVDDEVLTGGSICQAVNILKEHGARDVYVSFVHAGLTMEAAKLMSKLPVKEFIATDTIPITQEMQSLFDGRFKVLSIANLLGEVILRANEGRSVGEMFNE
ncbi:MAG: ribose-phosphate diphosphokinase [Anaerolineaceae bacterium]|nr:ribose-phosphate diphosphokinase [Anaerolineaceae bacterium]